MSFLKKKHTAIAGFTLVELMVAIGIYILMAALLFANQNKFNSSLAFSNLGYDIALTIRQAQTYGFAVRGENSGSTVAFTNAFGVHFQGDSPSKFQLFYEPIQGLLGATNPTPQPYDQSSNTTVLSTYNLQNNYTISALCYNPNNKCGQTTDISSGTCDPVSTSGSSAKYLDIIFQRPNLNAFMFNSAGPISQQVAIELESPQGEKECVSVFASGDIEVGTSTAPSPS